MDFTWAFTYDLKNLIIPSPDIVSTLLYLGIFTVTMIVLYYLCIFVAGIYIVYRDNKIMENKKRTLNDLVLMKDIQTELEKEIEQATLQAAFQS